MEECVKERKKFTKRKYSRSQIKISIYLLNSFSLNTLILYLINILGKKFVMYSEIWCIDNALKTVDLNVGRRKKENIKLLI